MPGPTLEELESVRCDPPDFGSHLVETCHRLRKQPIDSLSIEDLRILIGQNIGLLYLFPRAVDVLETNPLAEGDYYPGDLLVSVLRADRKAMREHPELVRRIFAIADRAENLLCTNAEAPTEDVEASLLREIALFRTTAVAQ